MRSCLSFRCFAFERGITETEGTQPTGMATSLSRPHQANKSSSLLQVPGCPAMHQHKTEDHWMGSNWRQRTEQRPLQSVKWQPTTSGQLRAPRFHEPSFTRMLRQRFCPANATRNKRWKVPWKQQPDVIARSTTPRRDEAGGCLRSRVHKKISCNHNDRQPGSTAQAAPVFRLQGKRGKWIQLMRPHQPFRAPLSPT